MDDQISWVRGVLASTPGRWESLVRDVPAQLFTRQPVPGEWSARLCLGHCIDTEELFLSRLAAFLAGSDFPAFDPETQGGSAWVDLADDALVAHFGELRKQALARVAELSPDDLERRVRHAELGMVALREMLHEWAGHDLIHLMQAERAMLQPFIRGCGPWRIYFTEHLIGD